MSLHSVSVGSDCIHVDTCGYHPHPILLHLFHYTCRTSFFLKSFSTCKLCYAEVSWMKPSKYLNCKKLLVSPRAELGWVILISTYGRIKAVLQREFLFFKLFKVKEKIFFKGLGWSSNWQYVCNTNTMLFHLAITCKIHYLCHQKVKNKPWRALETKTFLQLFLNKMVRRYIREIYLNRVIISPSKIDE